MNRSFITAFAAIAAVLFMMLLSCSNEKGKGTEGVSENTNGVNINVLQNSKSYPSSGELILEKKPFTLLFSFPEIPVERDTNITIVYWATTDASLESKFENAKHIDSISKNIAGINVASDNKDENLVINMKEGHSGLQFSKNGKTKDISHSFTNVQRAENRVDAFYNVRQVYDVNTESYISVDSIKDSNLYIYFALLDSKTMDQSEGHYIHIKFK